MTTTTPTRVKTIAEFHRLRGLPKPEHPLISVVNLDTVGHSENNESASLILDFYFIAIKRCLPTKFKYGQQVFKIEVEPDSTAKSSGWLLLIHPDFLWNMPLAKTIKQYQYFDYSVNEALLLSEKEETAIIGIMQSIQQEYNSTIDKFSQSIIIAQLELLLVQSDRFYHRQFITREIANHKILNRLEELLANYFNSDNLAGKGLPSVQYIADKLNVSPNYLSDLLKVLTGQSTQQHIHDKLIEKAKEKLSTTDLSVSEIAYELGFEHSQSFSKLFRIKTNISPMKFRQSFN